jgi:hypothetical protein
MSDAVDDLPLPKGWIRTFSNSQKRYYYSHKDTKHTQWHFPTASEASDPWMAKRRSEENQQREVERMNSGSSSSKRKATATTDGAPKPTTATNTAKRPRVDPSKHTKKPVVVVANHHTPTTTMDALLALADTTNVAIIVPYRDLHVEQKRAAHLAQFVPHMIQFLTKLQKAQKLSNFHVYIIDQSDDGRKFN